MTILLLLFFFPHRANTDFAVFYEFGEVNACKKGNVNIAIFTQVIV